MMLTEESRRDRNRRIDMGDDGAKLKIQGQTAMARSTPTLSQQVGAVDSTMLDLWCWKLFHSCLSFLYVYIYVCL